MLDKLYKIPTNCWTRDFASLGALIVIVGLAFDPFLQLLVFYEGMLGDVSNSNASIARSNFYNSGAENPNGNYCKLQLYSQKLRHDLLD